MATAAALRAAWAAWAVWTSKRLIHAVAIDGMDQKAVIHDRAARSIPCNKKPRFGGVFYWIAWLT
jgi:hypothetical protein